MDGVAHAEHEAAHLMLDSWAQDEAIGLEAPTVFGPQPRLCDRLKFSRLLCPTDGGGQAIARHPL